MDTQVVIIGGGPSGLAAALTLSRSMFRTTVINTVQPPRNEASPFVAALPAMDRKVPSEVRAEMRRDVLSYPFARFLDEDVLDIQPQDGGFVVQLGNGGQLTAQVVLLATGMQDTLPSLEGLEECWGRSVINCPFCHGYEWKDRKWGIYAHRQEVIDAAEIYRNWTSDLTYFLDSSIPIPEERRHELADMGITLTSGLPTRVLTEDETLSGVELPDGNRFDLDCMLIFPHQKHVELVSRLDVSLTDTGYIAIDEGFRTTVPGIYAAGDMTYGGHQNTPTALHMGNMAAATIVMDACFRS
ncbi:NAD(P)/FAD-dependent oxidoreductase [Roseibium sp. SCPC15]|uniref:NAD(P)/FAD-dependent oxidoreductase n=1 Tax=Roseibium sp. SCP15 TaxID=3141376 RepID=UPI00333CCA14